MMEYDAIVVGGGIAGLGATACLAKQGVRVLLCERTPAPGGLLRGRQRQGFTWERGCTGLQGKGILLPLLRSLGLEEQVRLQPLPVVRHLAGQRIELRSPEGLQELEAVVARASGAGGVFTRERKAIRGIFHDINRVREDMALLDDLDHPLFHEGGRDYLRTSLLPWLASYQQSAMSMVRLTRGVRGHLLGRTENVALVDLLTQHIPTGTPTYHALSRYGYEKESFYPEGGLGRLVDLLAEQAVADGAVLSLGTEVTAVDPGAHRVTWQDGTECSYRTLIWACDLRRLDAVTVGEVSPGQAIRTWQQNLGRGGDSVLSLDVALDLEPSELTELGPRTIYSASSEGVTSAGRWDAALAEGNWVDWLEAYLLLSSYTIACPAQSDASLAPAGQCALTASVRLDHRFVAELEKRGELEAMREVAERQMLRVLGESLVPRLRERLLFSELLTPLDLAEVSGSLDGAVAGWSFAARVMPVERRYTQIMRSVETPIPDVWQCGQWVYSPGSVASSLLTAKLAAEQVKRALAG